MNEKTFARIEAAVIPILVGWTESDVTNWIHAGWTIEDETNPDLDAWREAATQAMDEARA